MMSSAKVWTNTSHARSRESMCVSYKQYRTEAWSLCHAASSKMTSCRLSWLALVLPIRSRDMSTSYLKAPVITINAVVHHTRPYGHVFPSCMWLQNSPQPHPGRENRSGVRRCNDSSLQLTVAVLLVFVLMRSWQEVLLVWLQSLSWSIKFTQFARLQWKLITL